MEPPFPDHDLEQPLSLDVSGSGDIAVLDRGGRRLSFGRAGEAPRALDLDAPAIRCRFLGDNLVLLDRDGVLRTLRPDGETVGEVRVRAGAVNVAVTRGGGVLVSYGRRGTQEHGVTLERLGTTPLQHKDEVLLDATGLAVETGGYWIAGTGSEAPAARVVRLRPVSPGLKVRDVLPLPAPPRAAAIGPDGALYVLLEPGEALVRVRKKAGEPARLSQPAAELARAGARLLACGPRGLDDVSHVVPPPDEPFPEPDLPSCSP